MDKSNRSVPVDFYSRIYLQADSLFGFMESSRGIRRNLTIRTLPWRSHFIALRNHRFLKLNAHLITLIHQTHRLGSDPAFPEFMEDQGGFLA
jgi:hypothetical protein